MNLISKFFCLFLFLLFCSSTLSASNQFCREDDSGCEADEEMDSDEGDGSTGDEFTDDEEGSLILSGVSSPAGQRHAGSPWLIDNFFKAVKTRDFFFLEGLTQYHFNFSVTNSLRWSGLHYAALGGDMEMILFLIKNGASPDLVDLRGCLPMEIALVQGHLFCALALTPSEHRRPILKDLNPRVNRLPCIKLSKSL